VAHHTLTDKLMLGRGTCGVTCFIITGHIPALHRTCWILHSRFLYLSGLDRVILLLLMRWSC